MSSELSYSQLRTANEARQSEEVRVEQRRKCILVLILHHLTEEGFLDAARALEREAGPSIKKYEVCDNVDLSTVVQEYESYYQVKFRRQPKLVKRIAAEENGGFSKLPPRAKRSAKGESPLQLPNIHGAPPTSKRSAEGTRKSSSAGHIKKKDSTASTADGRKEPTATSSAEDLGLSGTAVKQRPAIGDGSRPHGKVVIDMKGMISSAIRDASSDIHDHSEDRLLRPLAGYTGFNSEMRELAAIIAKDIYLHSPNVRWHDIVGLSEAKRLIKEAVVYPIKYPQLFTGILSPWKGLLLYGPPGTGKTMLAKAVATECRTTFFNISASSIVSKWRGDSEKLVRVLFELARFHAPSTIFVDELESIMSQRGNMGGGGEHEGSRRLKTELLVQMDGLAKSSDLVFLLAASNLPWELDHAMLRRLEKRILVDLPTEEARCAMVRHYLPLEVTPPPLRITSDIDYEEIAKRTDGYSGSDVRLVCKEAAMRPVRKVFDKLDQLDSAGSGLENIVMDAVCTEDVLEALKRTKPSAKGLAHRYQQWQEQYESV